MATDLLEEVLSSRARLRIMDAVSTRPRTLGELSDLAGISVQGVLRHLNRLQEVGLVEERSLSRASPKARKVYAAKSARVRDASSGGFTVVRATELPPGDAGRSRVRDLEKAAGDLLVQRRRVREGVRKLARMIDEESDQQDDLESSIEGLKLSPTERLILRVVLTEDTVDDGERALTKYYGLGDRRSIESLLKKARRIA
ncbi:MAG: helix-turn-helix domain-containing protein [Nitrososphaerota archaeon]|nr:helix-turn-helix domain-containing protein [Nitrososphaerota archaeon]